MHVPNQLSDPLDKVPFMIATERLLDPADLPPFADIEPDDLLVALKSAIAGRAAVVDALVATRPADFANVWLPLERATTRLQALWSAVEHLHAVSDTPALRTAYAEGQRLLVEHEMIVGQNRDLYEVIAGVRRLPEFTTLPPADQACIDHSLRQFRLAGVALDPKDRQTFSDISIELSTLSTEFEAAVLDATDAWSELVDDEATLSGLSSADKAMLASAAASRDLKGWLVTLQQPSVNAILTFAEARALRERVYRAFGTRASDQGPHSGQFDNSRRIERILDLRHRAASLLGFANPVDWSLATKMASGAEEVLAFLRDLARRAKPIAECELADLRDFAATRLDLPDLQPWDIPFAANRLRQDRHAIDEQEVRAYFPASRVIEGWRTLLDQLFDITLTPRDDVPLWHPDARYLDVIDDKGATIAGLYLDLYARPGKRGGAWMSSARPRLNDGNISRVPVAYLVCNFAPPSDDSPSLLSHTDVITLLHETGHCLHHILTQVDRPSVAGTAGFEWDAVELPSQLMEDFGLDRDVLTAMSGHYLTGATLPRALFDKLAAARHFQSGMLLVRQIEFALFDLLLHLGTMGSDPLEVIESVRDEVAVIKPPEWHRFPQAFTHIFAGGYASGYYSYLWAEVLAADAFQKFVEAGLVDRATGDCLRAEILSRGATRPAAASFICGRLPLARAERKI